MTSRSKHWMERPARATKGGLEPARGRAEAAREAWGRGTTKDGEPWAKESAC